MSKFEVSTTYALGWEDVVNGELLVLAENSGFNVLLTADTNIKFQQNLSGRRISVLVSRAYDNRLKTHIEMIDSILTELEKIETGEITEVFHESMRE
jgi:hypothetical protein